MSEKIKSVLPYVPIAIIVGVIIYFNWDDFLSWRKGGKSPREMNGVYYIHTRDSSYRITFVIDSAWEKEYDPSENPR